MGKELKAKGVTQNLGYASRYMNSQNLQKGDAYLPLINAVDDSSNIIGDAMSLYTFHDWKGAIIGSTLSIGGGYSEAQQANLIPRVYLSYLATGIKRIFIYDLHSDGERVDEAEDNFGILRYNLQPKPAYDAYKKMTQALGTAPIFIQRIGPPVNNKIWALVFKRSEDQKQVLTVWGTDSNVEYTVSNKESGYNQSFSGVEVNFIPLTDITGKYPMVTPNHE